MGSFAGHGRDPSADASSTHLGISRHPDGKVRFQARRAHPPPPPPGFFSRLGLRVRKQVGSITGLDSSGAAQEHVKGKRTTPKLTPVLVVAAPASPPIPSPTPGVVGFTAPASPLTTSLAILPVPVRGAFPVSALPQQASGASAAAPADYYPPPPQSSQSISSTSSSSSNRKSSSSSSFMPFQREEFAGSNSGVQPVPGVQSLGLSQSQPSQVEPSASGKLRPLAGQPRRAPPPFAARKILQRQPASESAAVPESSAATSGVPGALSAAIASREAMTYPPHPLEFSNDDNGAWPEKPAASDPLSDASLPGMSLARILQQSLKNNKEGHRVVALRHVASAVPSEDTPPLPAFQTEALDWPPLLRRVTPAADTSHLVREVDGSPCPSAPAAFDEERPLSRAMRRCKM
jgi:hypothetical protein